jgi:hypothetical protein
MPHALGDQAGLVLSEVHDALFGLLEVDTQIDVNCSLQEVEQFVLFRMHFPFVTHSRRLHGKDADVPAVELNR